MRCTHDGDAGECPICVARITDIQNPPLATDWEADAAAANEVYGR